MQLYRAGYLKYDSGHNLLPVEDRFQMDEQIPCLALRRGKMVFPSPSTMTVYSYCRDGIYARKRNEVLYTMTADKKNNTNRSFSQFNVFH